MVKIVIEGCAHGELDNIYDSIRLLEEKQGTKVDLLICCGDFQAVRNEGDLSCLACPVKYRRMNVFYKYYSGEKVAPLPTLFIAGNHEASNHLWELPHGGWVAPNIFYMGYSGVVSFQGVRIAGLSGIYKSRDFNLPHFEIPPFSEDTKRSFYHVRKFDVFKLSQLSGEVDIVISHDWPAGVALHGNTAQLFRRKSFLQSEVESGTLGSPPAAKLLSVLQPRYWFSAHLHVKFAAYVQHPARSPDDVGRATRFLALDKCLPHHHYMQVFPMLSSYFLFDLCNFPLEE
eukprot:GCRY01002812.1.p1 GENE.GCRY01002812.1~~GCRY01002812.1.p1  ORF type:complete len:287 (+),score=26.69 GCRY01002812.1:52-912(+)